MLSQAEKRFIREQLLIYQCTEREVDIYLAALQSGPQSIQKLAGLLGQNRITVHSAVAQLIKKGLLFESTKGKRRLIAAEEPDSLFRLFQVKENELSTAKANLGYVVGLLRRVHTEEQDSPDVKFYQGVEGFKRMLEMTLSARNEFLAIIDVQLFSEHLTPEYLEDFFQRRADAGIRSRLIFPEQAQFAKKILEKAAEYRIQVRLLPSTFDWRSGFISWNNCISLKSISQRNISCTILENTDIVSFYRSLIFEVLWNTALKIK